jgi:hypothetical protein
MDKVHPSRWRRFLVNNRQSGSLKALERRLLWHRRAADRSKTIGQRPMPLYCRSVTGLLLFLAAISLAPNLFGTALSPAEARRIGHKIWQNECNGTVSGLTSWNAGENFASLGIGHFIWYPEDARGPFEESFPQLLAFINARSHALPAALNSDAHCPWQSRSEFLKAQNGPAMSQLRRFLADTVDLQSEFLVDRLNRSLPKMLEEASAAERSQIRGNFESLLDSGQGCYALVDYVNFKGEGVLHSERYEGQGWGLLQVLEEMKSGSGSPPDEFARAAAAVLKRRVKNAPSARNEQRWLAGWLKRVNSYSD